MTETKARTANSKAVAEANKIADFADQLLVRQIGPDLTRELTLAYLSRGDIFY